MSEDPTKEMRQPTLAEVLEAVNAIGVEQHSFRASIEKRLDEVTAGLRKVERQIGVLSSDIVSLRADVAELYKRLEQVEVKS
jgi:septal ring factor EnvC (AmiA/AmiB activator)